MLTLNQALSDQEDIEQLCKQKFSISKEIYHPNNNYGFAYLLKEYANYPQNEPLYATFPHGVYMRDRVIGKGELEQNLPAHLNFPPFTTPLWKKTAKNRKVIPFACPIHYALRLFRSEVPKNERKGTLFLPKHSTRAVNVAFNKESIIEELKNLPEEFHPVTVCIHWQDVEKGLHKYFQSKGFKVVSAGHLNDDNYMFRWLHLVSQFKLVAHSGAGSAMFYSVAAGIPFYLTTEEAKPEKPSNFQPFHKDIPHHSSAATKRIESLKTLFGQPVSQITKEQQDIVNYCTSSDLVLSPEDLQRQFKKLKALSR